LVQNDIGIRECTPTHEGEGRNLNDAQLQVSRDFLGWEDVVERIVKRAQVGIDLLAHVAGQEAKALSGLYGRPREDDPLHDATLKAMRGIGDGEVCLAGAGRS